MSKETKLQVTAIIALEQMRWQLGRMMRVREDSQRGTIWECPYCKVSVPFSQGFVSLPHESKYCLVYDYARAVNGLCAALEPYEAPWKAIGAHSVL